LGLKNKALFIQFRNQRDFSHRISSFEKFGYQFEDHLEIVMDLKKSTDDLWKDVHSKRRNEIRRARKNNLEFKIYDNAYSIDICYKILTEVYSRAKLPLPSKLFFQQLAENSTEKNGLKVFTATYENEIIGCLLGLVYKDKVYDFYAGSYKQYYHKYPNDLIPWEIFIWAENNNYSCFEFGGAGKPNVPYGVREYKKKFGGDIYNFWKI